MTRGQAARRHHARQAFAICAAGALVALGPGCRRQAPPAPVPPPVDARPADSAPAAARVVPPAPPPRAPLPANLPQGKLLTVLHGANLYGEYEPHPLGGLARRAALLTDLRSTVKGEGGGESLVGVVQVDAGDALLPPLPLTAGEPPPDPGEVERRARLIATALGRLQLDAYVPGETDLALGAETLKSIARRARLPVLAANLTDKRGKPFFEREKMITAGGVRVGLFGVVSLPQAALGELTQSDPAAAAQAATSVLRERGATIVIGVAHLEGGLDEARRLASAVTGVDAFVLGHDRQRLEDPAIAPAPAGSSAGAVIVAAGERGRHVGRLDFSVVDETGGFVVARAAGPGGVRGNWLDHEIITLDPRFVSDPAMIELWKPYIAESRRRMEKRLPVGLTARAGSKGEVATSDTENWKYATNAACALCHQKAMEHFASTSHAFALATLERKARHRDPYCLGCHSTGFDAPGGTRNLETANKYFGPTGCESCHGPSVTHVRAQNKTGTMLKVPPDVCARCHNPEHSPEPFDYATAVREILGPGHGG